MEIPCPTCPTFPISLRTGKKFQFTCPGTRTTLAKNSIQIMRYSPLSLSRPRLSRKSAYCRVKIWSLPKHENLTTGKKILWKRREIAPKEQFLLFSTIFSIYLQILRVQLHIYLLNVVVQIIFSSILQI